MKLGRGRTEQAPKQGSSVRMGRQGLSAYRQAHRAAGRQLGQWQDVVQAVDCTSSYEQHRAQYVGRQLHAGEVQD